MEVKEVEMVFVVQWAHPYQVLQILSLSSPVGDGRDSSSTVAEGRGEAAPGKGLSGTGVGGGCGDHM